MKIVFISNFYNHHQSALSQALCELTNNNFVFLETESMPKERTDLGWKREHIPNYVLNYDENSRAHILDADIVIIGSAPWDTILTRLKEDKLTYLYKERIYKNRRHGFKTPYRIMRSLLKFNRHKNLYLLSASAYTTLDFNRELAFLKKSFKWGYFPTAKEYPNINNLLNSKKPKSILWVARFISWKHPEIPIKLATKLKELGYLFEINMIGTGELTETIQKSINNENLADHVHILGAMSPEQVRFHMENSEIFIFTSDRNEGWGAVLNESMNSACAIVASHAIGSVPFLLEDGVNGLIYRDGDFDDLLNKVTRLLDNPDMCRRIGTNAYDTIINTWNAMTAARRLILLSQTLLDNQSVSDMFNSGPCSKAEPLNDNWYKC